MGYFRDKMQYFEYEYNEALIYINQQNEKIQELEKEIKRLKKNKTK